MTGRRISREILDTWKGYSAVMEVWIDNQGNDIVRYFVEDPDGNPVQQCGSKEAACQIIDDMRNNDPDNQPPPPASMPRPRM